MKKYRYVQFVDGPWNTRSKTGYLFIVDKKPESSIIEELSLIKCNDGYYTTLEQIGKLGWELAFVSPYGYLGENYSQIILSSYIFKKEIDE